MFSHCSSLISPLELEEGAVLAKGSEMQGMKGYEYLLKSNFVEMYSRVQNST